MAKLSKHTRNEENIYRSRKPVVDMSENEKAEYGQWMERRGLWDGELVLQNLERTNKLCIGNK